MLFGNYLFFYTFYLLCVCFVKFIDIIFNRMKFCCFGGGMNKNKGFTLIELMVTIAVLAIVTGIAAPFMNNMLLSQNLNKSTNTLISIMNEARAQAVLNRQNVEVDLLLNTVTPSSTEKEKMRDKLLFGWSPSGKSELKTSVSPIVFDMTGRVSSSMTDVVIEVCNKNSGDKSKIITISRMGIIQQIAEGTC